MSIPVLKKIVVLHDQIQSLRQEIALLEEQQQQYETTMHAQREISISEIKKTDEIALQIQDICRRAQKNEGQFLQASLQYITDGGKVGDIAKALYHTPKERCACVKKLQAAVSRLQTTGTSSW